MEFLWQKTVQMPGFGALEQDIKTDVLVIGGGMAGILCAYMLGQAGIDYVLAEADTLCSGVTKGTTAKITAQHGMVYHKLLNRFGMQNAWLYLQANQWAVEQ